MNIVLSTDDNFVQHCCVVITSVLKYNTGVHFFIFTEELSDLNKSILTELATSMRGELEFCVVDSKVLKKFPMPKDADAHISIATYYRLFVTKILPENIDRIIYLDCDIVVRKSLVDLWRTDIDKFAIGAVFQPITDAQVRDKARLKISGAMGYFNAGVLLVNLKYWREHGIFEKLMAFVEYNHYLIKQHDQDVLNAVLYREVLPVSYTWNFIPPHMNISNLVFPPEVNYTAQVDDPAVVHFVSAPKPWDFGCRHPFKNEYYKNLELTPFKNFKPKFNLKKYYNNVFKQKLLASLIKLDYWGLRKKIRGCF